MAEIRPKEGDEPTDRAEWEKLKREIAESEAAALLAVPIPEDQIVPAIRYVCQSCGRRHPNGWFCATLVDQLRASLAAAEGERDAFVEAAKQCDIRACREKSQRQRIEDERDAAVARVRELEAGLTTKMEH